MVPIPKDEQKTPRTGHGVSFGLGPWSGAQVASPQSLVFRPVHKYFTRNENENPTRSVRVLAKPVLRKHSDWHRTKTDCIMEGDSKRAWLYRDASRPTYDPRQFEVAHGSTHVERQPD
jgi:hypothetical protein